MNFPEAWCRSALTWSAAERDTGTMYSADSFMVAPQQWTRQFASSVVAIIFQLRCGDWTDALPQRVQNFGKPLAPSTRVNYLTALRTFFRDLQEWKIIPRRFDPIRTFA